MDVVKNIGVKTVWSMQPVGTLPQPSTIEKIFNLKYLYPSNQPMVCSLLDGCPSIYLYLAR